MCTATTPQKLPAATPASAPMVAYAAAAETAAQVFNKYDRNRDGVLDADEVTAMIDDIGYEVDPSYVGGVMGIFGRFDIDGGGTIDMSEFPALWEHLGGPPLAAEAATIEAPPPAAVGSAVPVEQLALQEEQAAIKIQARTRGRLARRRRRQASPSSVRKPPRAHRSSRSPYADGAAQMRAGTTTPTDASVVSAEDREAIMGKLKQIRHRQDRQAGASPVIAPSLEVGAPAPDRSVVVEDEMSVHHGKVGRLVSETPSGQFAIVRFHGERKTTPVLAKSLHAYEGGPARLLDAQPHRTEATEASNADGSDSLYEVIDSSSPFFGQQGSVVSTTPSGQFLCLRFGGVDDKPRPFAGSAVVPVPASPGPGSASEIRSKFAQKSSRRG